MGIRSFGNKIYKMGRRQRPVYKTNPFLESLSLKGNWKQIHVGNGKEVYNSEGEPLEVKIKGAVLKDEEEFLKVYRDGIKALLSLKSAGQKVAKIIVDKLYGKEGVNVDRVILNYELLSKEEQEAVKKTAFFNGINECIELDLIAQSVLPFTYFINPAFMFNGDRFNLKH